VIHSWKIPAFGVMQDAVPGRLSQLWFAPEREGIYFGQCSELCGKDHAYMPITVKVVSEEAYAAWVAKAEDWRRHSVGCLDLAATGRTSPQATEQIAVTGRGGPSLPGPLNLGRFLPRKIER
jgi:heme/copper-type cytochrome/quinol oxidase subunit 2